jgi:serine/threonine-protein kinase
MSDVSSCGEHSLPLSQARRINAVCNRFEMAWQAGPRPRLEDFLGELPEPERSALLRELIALDFDYRRQGGENPTAEEYHERFPTLDPPAEVSTVVDSPSPTDGAPDLSPRSVGSPQAGRYQLGEEIGHGGMGAVLQAHDPDLGREIVVKVLLPQHQGDPDTVRRFIEEAQIGGQLQHPGIVPVHDRGTLPDGRPYFTMKLVQGQTLADLLAQRPSPVHDLPRFLKVFEQVCQTLAFAHSRRVIHRDLKPSNVMVGSFGEVQVMDWGLAKVLGNERAVGKASVSEEMSTIATVRTADDDLATQEGAIMGTPAYMAPEQARGEVEQLDERCDVFGLGAILCVLLTGKPPYIGPSRAEVYRDAKRGTLEAACARLDACGADAELVRLTKVCLTPDPAERPRHAGMVAEAVGAYQARVQERLRQAEVERAQAQVKVAEERKRRRVTVLALAAVVLLLLVSGGVAAWWLQHQAVTAARQQEAEHRARDRMDQARALLQSAWQTADFARLTEARAQADQAVEIASGASDALQQEAVRLQQEVQARIDAAQRNRTLLAALLDVVQPRETKTYAKGEGELVQEVALPSVEVQYANAFRRWDGALDLDRTALDKILSLLQAQPEPVVQEVVAGLDAWALERRRQNRPQAEWRRLLEVAERLDRNDRRKEVRRLVTSTPPQRTPATAAAWDKARADLRHLATQVDTTREPVLGLLSLVQVLSTLGEGQTAERLLRSAVTVHRGEAVLLFAWGQLLEQQKPPRLAEAIECYRAACAVRPQLGVALGRALVQAQRGGEGEAVLRDMARREPNNPEMHFYLGCALLEQKKLAEAVASYQKALALRPDYPEAYNSLGIALHAQKKLEEAVASYQKALALRPDFPLAYYNLGNALVEQKKLAEAVASYQKALALRPDYPEAYNNLGTALTKQKKLKEAVTASQKAIALRPDYPEAYNNLGIALYEQKKLAEAVAVFQKAIALRPDYALAYSNLGNALVEQKKLAEAVAAYQKALALRPDFPEAYNNLGNAVREQRKLAEAVAAYRKAIALRPDYALAYSNLGTALTKQKKLAEAVAAYRKAIALRPDFPEAYYNLGTALTRQKKLAEAVAAYQKAIALRPDYPEAYINLGNALAAQRKLAEAVAAYQKAIALRPDYPQAYSNLGAALREQKKLAEAVVAFRKANKFLPGHPLIGANLQQTERWLELDKKFPTLLAGQEKPPSAREGLEWADFCARYKQSYVAAARFFAEALTAKPPLADNLLPGVRYQAACCATLAAAGQGVAAAKLDAKEKSRLRQQALAWLRDNLQQHAKQLADADAKTRQGVQQTLQHWQQDPDLASVRNMEALAKLPEAERAAWQQFWADVEKLLKKAAP